jgi:hypothetical protein
MGLTRREFLTRDLPAILGLAFVGGLIGSEVYWDLKKPSNEIIYEGNATETVTITVTKTYTSNTTVTETVTENMIVTGTSTQTTTTTTQTSQSLEDILFGGSDMQFIPLEVTNIQMGTNNAYLTVYDYLTNTELQIKLPIQYVSNRNINIGNLLSAVNNYNQNPGTNYKVYLVLGRAGLSQAVQQNGVWYLPAPQIYYNILITDREWQDVYNALLNLLNGNATVVMPTSYQGPYSNSLWAWINGIGNVVTVYQSGQQVNSVEDYINLADYILGTKNNQNPTSGGILHVDTIANVQQVGVYNSGGNQYPVYGVNDYYGTYIVLIPGKGNLLVSNL